jgi:hypothetical protein
MQMPTGVVLRRTADLVPYANNASTHTLEQVKQIASASEKAAFRHFDPSTFRDRYQDALHELILWKPR